MDLQRDLISVHVVDCYIYVRMYVHSNPYERIILSERINIKGINKTPQAQMIGHLHFIDCL